MTIITSQSRVTYAGDGVSLNFPIPFEFFLNTDISAVLTSASGGVAALTYGVDFLLTNANVPGGGTFNKLIVVPIGTTLSIYLNPPITQGSHYVSNAPFPAATLELDLDRQAQISQRLQDQINRCIRGGDGDLLASAFQLPIPSARANLFLGFDGVGNLSLGQVTSSILSAAVIGGLISPQTPGEATAGVAPLQPWFVPGDLRRYGCDPTGVADASVGMQNALNSNSYVLGGGAYCTYQYNAALVLPRDIYFNGQGCKLKPVVAGQFARNPQAADVATTCTLLLEGSLSATLASVVGIVVGQEIVFNSAGTFLPYFWAKVKALPGGNVVTLDRPAPFDYMNNTNSTGVFAWQATTAYAFGDFVTNGGNIYFCAIPGTSAGAGGPLTVVSDVAIADNLVTWVFCGAVNASVYNAGSTMGERCWFTDVDWDGSLYTTPGSLGMCVRAGTYRSVNMSRMRFQNFSVAAPNQPVLLGLYYGLDCNVEDLTVEENQIWSSAANPGEHIDIQGYRKARFNNNAVDGSGFGCDMTFCELATANGNTLTGRKTYERFIATALPWSARGIKATRCGHVTFDGNVSSDYETPLRTDRGIRATFSGNKIYNADIPQGAFTNTTGSALNCTSSYNPLQREYVIIGNTIRNAGGNGINLSSGVGVFSGRNIIAKNSISGCNAAGIFSTDSDNVFDANRVQNWDRSVSGFGAIHTTAKSQTYTGNRFNHETDATRFCFNTLTAAGGNGRWCISGNAVESLNPLIQGGLGVEFSGATTIASGSTGPQTITHKLPTGFTPDATHVKLTIQTAVPTNHPRQVNADTFTGTQFAIRTDADPGASGIAIAWRIALPQTFSL